MANKTVHNASHLTVEELFMGATSQTVTRLRIGDSAIPSASGAHQNNRQVTGKIGVPIPSTPIRQASQQSSTVKQPAHQAGNQLSAPPIKPLNNTSAASSSGSSLGSGMSSNGGAIGTSDASLRESSDSVLDPASTSALTSCKKKITYIIIGASILLLIISVAYIASKKEKQE